MRSTISVLLRSVFFCLLCGYCSSPAAASPVGAIRLGAYEGTRTDATHLIRIYSPWYPGQYLSINFPEHCWGKGLPNVTHMSQTPITTPWRYNADSTEAVFELQARPGVIYRSRARVDSMAVRLSLEIENKSDSAITDVRTLICLRPDQMASFKEHSYDMTWVFVGGRPAHMDTDTHYDGPLPEGHAPSWALRVAGVPDSLDFSGLSWFTPGGGPGRIVQERAQPPLIALHERGNEKRWLATIWQPAKLVFSNPSIPCIHSDPLPPDCPPGQTVRVKGMVLFHDGDIESLLVRARKEMGL